MSICYGMKSYWMNLQHNHLKRLVGLLLLMFFFIPMQAQQVWTVKTVPNTRLQSNAIHISNPDNIVSDDTEQHLNRLLDTVRPAADVFVVALHSVGEVAIEKFVNDLFNAWAIGEADANNGVLLLMVEDQHKV